jgi:RNA polymerase sigma-70 factor (ECF subfamily)
MSHVKWLWFRLIGDFGQDSLGAGKLPEEFLGFQLRYAPPMAAQTSLLVDPQLAISELVRRCGPMVHAVVLRLTHNRADADDVVQEAFLSAYKHWGEFRGESQPCTWLHSIAVRAALRRGRREARRRDVARDYARAMPFMQSRLAEADFPSRSVEARELRADARARVDAAMRDVAEPFRSALVLKEIAGMPIDSVAKVLGVKAATVKTRLYRGRLLLRAALLSDRPRTPVPAAVYDRATCMDLLRAKMEALDRGVDFPVQDELVCERCRQVFASLDVGADACRSLRGRTMPAQLRKSIEKAIREGVDVPPARKRVSR